MFSRKSVQDYIDKAGELLKAGDIGAALENLGKALEKEPTHAQG